MNSTLVDAQYQRFLLLLLLLLLLVLLLMLLLPLQGDHWQVVL
jgi:hypothetical protein